MSGRKTDVAELSGAHGSFAIVAARFHQDITERLVTGALERFERAGAKDVPVEWVAGSFELPLAARTLARRCDGVVALGCIIRGQTPHFDFVSVAAANGLMQAALEADTPIAFGVLTTETRAQAESRAGGDHGNKGWDAAETVLEMSALQRKHR